MARGQTVVKETVVNGIRLTADFPPYALGDDLAYRVTLNDVRNATFIHDASVLLIATPQPARPDAHELRVSPVEHGGGSFLFRPALTSEGAYRLAVVVERVGATALDPPVQVEHTIGLMKPMAHGSEGQSWLAGATPLVVLGAAAMAVMMLLMFR